uniref:BTB domain-containing protein n=1 Tax=Romanomermis culicivorax TaxID=13658 RepID=A0A915ISJ1_ROMCU
MSILLSPISERNFCLLVDKFNDDNSDDDDSGDGEKSQEKVKIWVSKGFLAVVSPVFNKMFYGDFRESELSATNEPIYLPGKNDKDFLQFLDCLFPYSTQSDIDEANVETILRLSDEYQVKYLMDRCDQYYENVVRGISPCLLGLDGYIGYQTVLTYLPVILKYKLKRATEACVPLAATLHMSTLTDHRLKNRPALDGYHQFYSAVYEAKQRSNSKMFTKSTLFRLSTNKHKLRSVLGDKKTDIVHEIYHINIQRKEIEVEEGEK